MAEKEESSWLPPRRKGPNAKVPTPRHHRGVTIPSDKKVVSEESQSPETEEEVVQLLTPNSYKKPFAKVGKTITGLAPAPGDDPFKDDPFEDDPFEDDLDGQTSGTSQGDDQPAEDNDTTANQAKDEELRQKQQDRLETLERNRIQFKELALGRTDSEGNLYVYVLPTGVKDKKSLKAEYDALVKKHIPIVVLPTALLKYEGFAIELKEPLNLKETPAILRYKGDEVEEITYIQLTEFDFETDYAKHIAAEPVSKGLEEKDPAKNIVIEGIDDTITTINPESILPKEKGMPKIVGDIAYAVTSVADKIRDKKGGNETPDPLTTSPKPADEKTTPSIMEKNANRLDSVRGLLQPKAGEASGWWNKGANHNKKPLLGENISPRKGLLSIGGLLALGGAAAFFASSAKQEAPSISTTDQAPTPAPVEETSQEAAERTFPNATEITGLGDSKYYAEGAEYTKRTVVDGKIEYAKMDVSEFLADASIIANTNPTIAGRMILGVLDNDKITAEDLDAIQKWVSKHDVFANDSKGKGENPDKAGQTR